MVSKQLSTLPKGDILLFDFLQRIEVAGHTSVSFLNESGVHEDLVLCYSALASLLKLDICSNGEYLVLHFFVQELERATLATMIAVLPNDGNSSILSSIISQDVDMDHLLVTGALVNLKSSIRQKLNSFTIPKFDQHFHELLNPAHTKAGSLEILRAAFDISFGVLFGVEHLYFSSGACYRSSGQTNNKKRRFVCTNDQMYVLSI